VQRGHRLLKHGQTLKAAKRECLEREREREGETEKYRLYERRHRRIISRLATYETCNKKVNIN